VIQAESGGSPTAYNPSSGASGLFGFLLSTWDSLGLGYPGGAFTAPASVQEQGFAIEYARAGTSPWAPYDGC
jgi:resuscitation-promoting factor RpfA